MKWRHILRASVTGILDNNVWRPDSLTSIIEAGVIFERALNRSIPKKPSTVANFRRKDSGVDGVMKYAGGVTCQK